MAVLDDIGSEPLAEFGVVDTHHRCLDDVGMIGKQILDFQRKDVLTAGDDHVVVAAVDEPQAGFVEVPGVAGGQQALDDLFVAAVGVAGETQTTGHEYGADPAGFGYLAAILVVDSHRATDGWATDGAGRAVQFVRRGDRGDRHLGGTVQVVQHGAERVVSTTTERRVTAQTPQRKALSAMRCRTSPAHQGPDRECAAASSAPAPPRRLDSRRSPSASPAGRSAAPSRRGCPAPGPARRWPNPSHGTAAPRCSRRRRLATESDRVAVQTVTGLSCCAARLSGYRWFRWSVTPFRPAVAALAAVRSTDRRSTRAADCW